MEYAIATGNSRTTATWRNRVMGLEEFISKLQTPKVTNETMAEYAALDHESKVNAKDAGGYVAGSLKDGKRKLNYVKWRSMITLDLDNVEVNTDAALQRISDQCPYYCIVHPSHSHRPDTPRLRLIIPLETPVTEEQYEPIARRLAADVGIEWFDQTTYQAARFMFWPSVPRDLDYDAAFRVFDDRPILNGATILARYADWHNVAEWPMAPGEADARHQGAQRQGDPLIKNGPVGDFCRVYTIEAAIETFLSDVYTPTQSVGRYTYVGGSTVGGLVLYDDKFAYDNHGTSPASGMLCNSFDLVRVHKFGGLDDNCKNNTGTTKRPSYKAMCEFVANDAKVREYKQEQRNEAIYNDFDFDDAVPAPNSEGLKPRALPDNAGWDKDLVCAEESGKIKSTINNLFLIISNDPMLRGRLIRNSFNGRDMVLDPLPWTQGDESIYRDWSDDDTSGLRMYLEKYYDGLNSKEKTEAALTNVFNTNRVHPIREYLINLPEWDGVPRVETLLVDYLGAEDNEFNRTVTRTHLVASVARIMEPGIKYDTMLTLSGPQGIGKSTLPRLLYGDEYFDDSLRDFKGKEPFELLQGRWAIEISELAAVRKSDKEDFKAFISKTADAYRPAYGHRTVQYKRQCVFWGTTNESTFLRDETGDRRTFPVAVGVQAKTKDVFKDLLKEKPQIWAETLALYRAGCPIVLTPEMEKVANEARCAFKEENPLLDAVTEFLNIPICAGWNQLSEFERRNWLDDESEREGVHLIPRESVTALEVWVECLGRNINDFNKPEAKKIDAVLYQIEGWRREQGQTRLDVKVYGGIRKKVRYVRK